MDFTNRQLEFLARHLNLLTDDQGRVLFEGGRAKQRVVRKQVAMRSVVWSTDFEAAQRQAREQGKKLLLDFTGSDWCQPCKMLEKYVFESEAFAAFAQDYILVRLDFPRRRELSPNESRQNAELKARYAISGFPTVIVLDADGTELRRRTGFEPNTSAYSFLQSLQKKAH